MHDVALADTAHEHLMTLLMTRSPLTKPTDTRLINAAKSSGKALSLLVIFGVSCPSLQPVKLIVTHLEYHVSYHKATMSHPISLH